MVPDDVREFAEQTIVVADGCVFQAGCNADGYLHTSWCDIAFEATGSRDLLLNFGLTSALDAARMQLRQFLCSSAERSRALDYFLFSLLPLVAVGGSSALTESLSVDDPQINPESLSARVPNPFAFVEEGNWFSFLGRIWRLESGPAADNGVRFESNSGHKYFIAEQFRTLGDIWFEWEERVTPVLISYSDDLCGRTRLPQMPSVAEAQKELTFAGFIQRGPLLLLDDGTRLGHIVPSHQNRTIGPVGDNELAITCQFSVPPSMPPQGLAVFKRQHNKWKPVRLTHGLCLGHIMRDDSSCPLLAWLSRAAMRIAAAGRFHEHEH